MKVKLKRVWVLDGTRYRPDPNGVVVADANRSRLPSDAVIIEEVSDEQPAPTAAPKQSKSKSKGDELED